MTYFEGDADTNVRRVGMVAGSMVKVQPRVFHVKARIFIVGLVLALNGRPALTWSAPTPAGPA